MTAVDDSRTASAVTDTEATPTEPERDELEPGVRWWRGRVWLGLGGAVVAAVGVGIWWWAATRSTEAAPANPGPAATATVERGMISATESWDGTLDRGMPLTVRSGAGGTVTRLTDQGATVGRGDVLFRVDEQPVVLLSGVVPMYRDLGPGASGVDVNQLEANLAALGYAGFAADDEYDSSTAEAVSAWQEDIGAALTGTVARGYVVFVPAGGRVDTLRSGVGDVVAPGTAILDITGSDQVVNLEVEVDDRDRFAVDTAVTVLLPGGDEVTGSVSSATVVEVGPQSPDGASGGEGGGEAANTDTEPVVLVEIALAESAPDELVGSPVEVVVGVDERTDVLLVPVTALLALAEGGYGLEVVADDGSASIVAVETGLFAEGKVEVDSPDIADGTVVGVAGR